MNPNKLIDELCLIDDIIPDYVAGRRMGLTDGETESIAHHAIGRAIEALEKQIPKKPEKQDEWLMLLALKQLKTGAEMSFRLGIKKYSVTRL
ncbi:MAG TPA: hypothetical protein VFD33_06235 [Bacillota bacterium]|nr:hypothetical protein [Bacillota bacterium]